MDHITSGKESADGDEMADDLAANAYMKYLCKKNKVDLFDNRNAESTVYSNKELGKFVTYVHDKFPFARYDYLRNSFYLYDLRFIGILYQMVQTIAFTSASKDSFKLNERLEEVFPTSTIHPYIDRIELIRDHLLDALKDDPRRTFTADEEKQLLSELNEIWSKDPQEHYSEIGYFLSKIGYERRRASKDRSRPSYDKFRYLKKPRDEFPGTAY